MIKFEELDIHGWEASLRGMRNPKNSWHKSDSFWDESEQKYHIGPNDLQLATALVKAGPEHRKFIRMVHISLDITAPLYWWKEFDTYKIGTVADSCSTMHKIHSKPIELSDFSIDDFYMDDLGLDLEDMFINVAADCEALRQKFIETDDKRYWKGLIQLLPTSYNQKRTVDISFEALLSMCKQRKNHKQEEWNIFRQYMFNNVPYLKYFYCVMTGEDYES